MLASGFTDIPDAVEHLRKPYSSGTPRPRFKLILDRERYFDNDKVEGVLQLYAEKETVLPPVYIALLCRLVVRGYASVKPIAHTIYRYHKTPGPEYQDSFTVPAGETNIRFFFNLPENTPSSFSERDSYLSWEVKFLQRGKRVDHSLATTPFKKASLYYRIPGHSPKAQIEQQSARGDHTLLVEATLGKDVYHNGDPVEVKIVVHTPGDGRYISLKGLKAYVYQVVKVDAKVIGPLIRAEYQLDSCKHDVRTWDCVPVAGELGGTIMEKTFMMMPRLDEEENCCLQSVTNEEGVDTHHLASTVYVDETARGCSIDVQYFVRLKGSVVGGRNFILNIPFSIESAFVKSPEAGSVQDPHQEGLKVFPLIEEPPPYEEFGALSVSSYTNLRKNSKDSVYSYLKGDFQTGLGVQEPPSSTRRYSIHNMPFIPSLLKPSTSETSSPPPIRTISESTEPSPPLAAKPRRYSHGLMFPMDFIRMHNTVRDDGTDTDDSQTTFQSIGTDSESDDEDGLPSFDDVMENSPYTTVEYTRKANDYLVTSSEHVH